MAQKIGRQGEWPTVRGNPRGFYQTADGVLRSDRSLAGPLRTGTEPRVGPRAGGPVAGDESRSSDFGMDRISPRGFDPMGTSLEREPRQAPSDLVTRDVRRGNGD